MLLAAVCLGKAKMLWQACVLRPGKQARALGRHSVKLHYGGGFDEEPSIRLPEECMCHTQRLVCFCRCCREGDLSRRVGQLCRNASRLLCCPKLWKLLGIGMAERDALCSFPGLLHSSQPKGLKQHWKPSVLGIMCAVGTLFIWNRKQYLP